MSYVFFNFISVPWGVCKGPGLAVELQRQGGPQAPDFRGARTFPVPTLNETELAGGIFVKAKHLVSGDPKPCHLSGSCRHGASVPTAVRTPWAILYQSGIWQETTCPSNQVTCLRLIMRPFAKSWTKWREPSAAPKATERLREGVASRIWAQRLGRGCKQERRPSETPKGEMPGITPQVSLLPPAVPAGASHWPNQLEASNLRGQSPRVPSQGPRAGGKGVEGSQHRAPRREDSASQPLPSPSSPASSASFWEKPAPVPSVSWTKGQRQAWPSDKWPQHRRTRQPEDLLEQRKESAGAQSPDIYLFCLDPFCSVVDPPLNPASKQFWS